MRFSLLLILQAILALGTARHAHAQEAPRDSAELGVETVPIIARSGPALVLLTEGPTVPSADIRSGVNYRWFVVQDSTSGVVFRKRGGFKAEGSGVRFDGDIDISTTREITAIEFGVATFNIWNEFTGAWFVTDIRDSEEGDEFDLNPRAFPCRPSEDADGIVCYSMSKHYTSVLWVSRVRYQDGSVIVKDRQPVIDAIKTFSDEVKPEQLLPEAPLQPQLPPGIVES